MVQPLYLRHAPAAARLIGTLGRCAAVEINGHWIASADSPDGPSLGVGLEARDAIEQALEPFDGVVDERLASVPNSRFGSPE